MKKFNILLVSVFLTNVLSAHCQIPCGIYDDSLRIIQIKENLNTIEKAMNKITLLSSESNPQSSQQLVRWVNAKEKHADEIQSILAEYFLAQRISEKKDDYLKQLSSIQKLMVNSMKCKQTINVKFIKSSNTLLDNFIGLYFDSHGIEHLKELGYLN